MQLALTMIVTITPFYTLIGSEACTMSDAQIRCAVTRNLQYAFGRSIARIEAVGEMTHLDPVLVKATGFFKRYT